MITLEQREKEHKDRNCVFCELVADGKSIEYRRLRLEDIKTNGGKIALAMLDKEPKVLGHTLVISRMPLNDITDTICRDEKISLFRIALDLAEQLKQILKAEKVYIMSMCEHWEMWETANGRTTEHLHFHLVPRYPGMRTKAEAGENLLARKGLQTDLESLSQLAQYINHRFISS